MCHERSCAKSSLRISTSPAFAANWLLGKLTQFQMMYPDIEIEMHASYELVDLAVDEIDVAIRYGDGNWGDLFCHRLLTDQLFPVRSPAYLQAKGLSAPHDLSRAVLLRYCREPWLPWFQAAGLIWPEPQTGPIFNDLGLVLEAALLSYGVALARSTIVEKSMAAGRLQKLFDVTPRGMRTTSFAHQARFDVMRQRRFSNGYDRLPWERAKM